MVSPGNVKRKSTVCKASTIHANINCQSQKYAEDGLEIYKFEREFASLSVRVYQVPNFRLGIPPISHLSDKCGFLQFGAGTAAIVDLVEDKVEIAAGAVDVVEQKVGRNHTAIAVPLGKQFGKESCGEGIAYTRTENARIE